MTIIPNRWKKCTRADRAEIRTLYLIKNTYVWNKVIDTQTGIK